jgi:predicted naringenin-chalcone synthase
MSWRIGDHGFEMTLSPLVPAIVARATRAPVEAWLARHGLTVERVAAWGVHPGGPRILDACVEGLGLGADALDASRRVLAQHGNMSSPTVLFVLEELLQAGVRGPCVLLGFGPGLAIEAALLEI